MIWLQLAIAILWTLSTGASLIVAAWLVYRHLTKQSLNR